MLHHHRLYSWMSAKWELSKYLPLLPACKNKIPDGPVILSQSLIDWTIRLVCWWPPPPTLSPENVPGVTAEDVKSKQTSPKFSWQLSFLFPCDSAKSRRIFWNNVLNRGSLVFPTLVISPVKWWHNTVIFLSSTMFPLSCLIPSPHLLTAVFHRWNNQ